ncbi:MAG TPA: hypothetical protein VFZ65_20855 [Planctomycetota bacterium]|nr:hypothetical protein [Planctomycetota bacterium]
MRTTTAAAALVLAATATAQCPYYASGTISAGLSRAGGGEDARLVYVDCLSSIGVVYAKFGTTNGSTNLNGRPLTIAIYDDPTNDLDPHDAVLVAQTAVPGGVTGGNTGQWQRYDLNALLGAPVPATGGMWVAVGVTYPAATSPGPGSIEFFNNIAPGTQWLATDSGGVGIDYSNLSGNQLVDIQTGPGFPPGSWVILVESGAEYRSFGSGCPGSNGTPTLTGGSVLPVLGQIVLFDAVNLPNPSLIDLMVLGQGLLSPAIDLGLVFGSAPVGCTVAVQPIVLAQLTTVSGNASLGIPVPLATNLVGESVLGQVVSLDPTANAAGWTSSNGVRAVLGY